MGPAVVVVDEPGLSGGVIDRLAEQGMPVVAYNGGRRAGLMPNPERFKNRRAAAYWMLRRRLEDGDLALTTLVSLVPTIGTGLGLPEDHFRKDSANGLADWVMLILHVVDASPKELVWRGAAQGEVDLESSPTEREEPECRPEDPRGFPSGSIGITRPGGA